jgi:hypothetical protein
LMVPDREGGWVHINSVEARAVKALEKRIATLEGVLRKVYADNAGEVDQSFDPAVIEAVFECRECLDTGVVGGMPKGDENDSCCARCALGGNPYFRAYGQARSMEADIIRHQVGLPPRTIVHDGSGLARTVVIDETVELCHAKDPHSPRVCMRPKGHEGDHLDPTFRDEGFGKNPTRHIDTDKEWP